MPRAARRSRRNPGPAERDAIAATLLTPAAPRRPNHTTGEYATSTDGRYFMVAARGAPIMLALNARECVELSARLLAGATLLFKEEDATGRRS